MFYVILEVILEHMQFLWIQVQKFIGQVFNILFSFQWLKFTHITYQQQRMSLVLW